MSAAPEEPSHSPRPGTSPIGSSAASNLYLVTFLATLFLLLVFSCGIVMRSYIIRRRIMRRFEEVIAADTLPDPRTGGTTRKRRPKFYDRWITPATNNEWESIMPLALRVVFGKRSQKQKETKKTGIMLWKSASCANTDLAVQSDNPSTSPKFEIVQVTALIEMPSPERSTLYGHLSFNLKSVDGDDHAPLPELVMGYARCHKH